MSSQGESEFTPSSTSDSDSSVLSSVIMYDEPHQFGWNPYGRDSLVSTSDSEAESYIESQDDSDVYVNVVGNMPEDFDENNARPEIEDSDQEEQESEYDSVTVTVYRVRHADGTVDVRCRYEVDVDGEDEAYLGDDENELNNNNINGTVADREQSSLATSVHPNFTSEDIDEDRDVDF